jgi:hypothetical protein
MDQAEPVIGDEAAVHDQVRRDARRDGVGSQHGHADIVVAVGLVAEAPAGRVHRDQPGLRAVQDDVRPDGLRAVLPRHDRARHPQTRALHRIIQHGALRERRVDGVARVALRGQREVLRRFGEQRRAQGRVARQAAGGQHDAPLRRDRAASPRPIDDGAGHAPALADQPDQPGAEPDRHRRLAQAVEQPADQGVAHDQVGAAVVAKPIQGVAPQQRGDPAEVRPRPQWRQQLVMRYVGT